MVVFYTARAELAAGLATLRSNNPYFALNKNRKTYLIYLEKKREDKAREYSQNPKETF